MSTGPWFLQPSARAQTTASLPRGAFFMEKGRLSSGQGVGRNVVFGPEVDAAPPVIRPMQ